MNRFLTTIFMLSLISFMILLSSFIEYDNHESITEYNVYYPFENLYNNESIIDSIMTNKSNIELFRINRNGTAIRKRFKIDLTKRISEDNNPTLSTLGTTSLTVNVTVLVVFELLSVGSVVICLNTKLSNTLM